ncbi:MAG TPA: glycosyltransferase family A protein [Candidatus Binatia bacterium]|nr:glycosyltransferase family A protein [Candidatus Binatia bacterium]
MDSLPPLPERPSVSVIIPTYNRSAYLRSALQSVFAQTRAPLEVIVVDDGSNDDTAAVLASYGDRVRTHRRAERGGPSAARNDGLDLARGDLIAFLDSDDEWHPDKLAVQVAALAAATERVGGVFCTMQHLEGAGVVSTPALRAVRPSVKLMCITNVPGSPSAVMIRRDACERLGRFDLQLPPCEDWDLWLRVAMSYGWLGIEQRLVTYRRHPGQLSSSLQKNFQGRLRFFRKHYALIRAEAPETLLEWHTGLPRLALLAGDFAAARELQAELCGVLPSLRNRALLRALRWFPGALRAAALARRRVLIRLR